MSLRTLRSINLSRIFIYNVNSWVFPSSANYYNKRYKRVWANINTTENYYFPNTETMSAPVIFKSIQPILDVLNARRKTSQHVDDLIKVYNDCLKQYKQAIIEGELRKYPLIVLEGLDGSGKSTVGFRLAKQIQAIQWCTPPKSIHHLRPAFDDNELRAAYYSLGNYIAALEVHQQLKNNTVVMDRYWHSTTAYALAQAVKDYPEINKMPEPGNSVYYWPKDLLKPDIVLFLNVSENVRLERHSRRRVVTVQENHLKNDATFRQNVIVAYKNMDNPVVEFINADLGFRDVLNEIVRKTEHLFDKKYTIVDSGDEWDTGYNSV